MIGNGVTFTSIYKIEDDETRVVSFSSEKHKLLQKIKIQDTGCELKKFYLNKNEIIINDREVQPNFRKIEKKVYLLP